MSCTIVVIENMKSAIGIIIHRMSHVLIVIKFQRVLLFSMSTISYLIDSIDLFSLVDQSIRRRSSSFFFRSFSLLFRFVLFVDNKSFSFENHLRKKKESSYIECKREGYFSA